MNTKSRTLAHWPVKEAKVPLLYPGARQGHVYPGRIGGPQHFSGAVECISLYTKSDGGPNITFCQVMCALCFYPSSMHGMLVPKRWECREQITCLGMGETEALRGQVAQTQVDVHGDPLSRHTSPASLYTGPPSAGMVRMMNMAGEEQMAVPISYSLGTINTPVEVNRHMLHQKFAQLCYMDRSYRSFTQPKKKSSCLSG